MAELLNILKSRYPIIQGPIGRIRNPKLVAAVSEAGAYGMLALGFGDAAYARDLVQEVKSLTDKPFGANVVIRNSATPEILEILAEAGVKAVTTAAGAPDRIYKRIHELGMKGIHVVLSLLHAQRAEEAGADALVVAGAEAGGVRTRDPESSTMVLVPLVADHVKIPIVAAGGIADSRGYRAALALGAQGVQVGTRFLASQEFPIHEAWKQAILDCGDGGTFLFPIYWGMSTRVIITPKLKAALADSTTDLESLFDIKSVPKMNETGNIDLFPPGGGQVSALIRDIKPVKTIIEDMVS